MYNFTMYGAFPESEGGSDMLFVASPQREITIQTQQKSSRPSVAAFFVSLTVCKF